MSRAIVLQPTMHCSADQVVGCTRKVRLPRKERFEQLWGDREDAPVIPRNGEVWERTFDDEIVISQAENFMIELTLGSIEECPDAPTIENGVPIVDRVSGT